MFEGLVISLAFVAVGFLGWWRESVKFKDAARRSEVAEGKFQAERQRRLVAEQQVEWFRSNSSHPSMRRGSK